MPICTYSFLGLVQQLTNLTAALLTSLKVICSCKVPVSFFFRTLPSLTALPYSNYQVNPWNSPAVVLYLQVDICCVFRGKPVIQFLYPVLSPQTYNTASHMCPPAGNPVAYVS